jgi:plastocyanin
VRRILITLVALGALVASSSDALAATRNVEIRRNAFAPADVRIVAGDTIRWRNVDTRNHQVVSTTGTFASPVLAQNRAYAFTFEVAGTYRYRDALNPSITGVVRVAGRPPALTFATSFPQIIYGNAVTLSGQINSRQAGEQVVLTHQPYGQPSPIVLATVLTGADGTFSLLTRPKILTTYQATWKTARSLVVATAIKPAISFGRNNGFVTRVFAGRSMARKHVQLQRLSSFGQWVTIKRVQLDLDSRARFRAALPFGVSRLRIAFSVNQAGVGYLGALSREITFRRVT